MKKGKQRCLCQKFFFLISFILFFVSCDQAVAHAWTAEFSEVVSDSVNSYQITRVSISEEAIVYSGFISFNENVLNSRMSCTLHDGPFSVVSHFNPEATDAYNGTEITSTGHLTFEGEFSFYFDPVVADLQSFKDNPDAYLISLFAVNKIGMQRTYLKIYSHDIEI